MFNIEQILPDTSKWQETPKMSLVRPKENLLAKLVLDVQINSVLS